MGCLFKILTIKVTFCVPNGPVNEDWDVSKEVSREAKANYTKAGTGDLVHIRTKQSSIVSII